MPSNKKPLAPNLTCLHRSTEMNRSPEEWLTALRQAADTPVRSIKDGRPKRTVMTHLPPWGVVCLHDYRWGLRKGLLSAFRPLQGQHVWQNCLSLMEQTISIAEPLMYLEIKNGPFIMHTYFVTRWIEGENLAKTAREPDRISKDRLLSLLRKAVILAAGLHTRGFVHGDLKWSNFLWVDDPNTQVYLSDMDHLKKNDSARKQGKDLARFILATLEFGLGDDIADTLLCWYCDLRPVRPAGFNKSLRRRMEKKRSRYESRGSRLIEEYPASSGGDRSA
jgi:tRNA A-37 threonylcarbamoyl transferase component Bud32